MKIKEIVKILKAKKHFIPDGDDLDVAQGIASDLMSDVLAYVSAESGTLLITSLMSNQVIRTSTLMGISIVVFTRGKIPTKDIINAAKRNDIAILSTELTKYTACGLLYTAGLKSIDGYMFKGEE